MDNHRIIQLFQKMDAASESYSLLKESLYWDIKVTLVCEISKKYGPVTYDAKTIERLHIPAAFLSMIVNMERINLGLVK